MLTSALCTQAALDTAEFRRWVQEIRLSFKMHRKLWEHGFIAQALEERGFLKPGVRGLGFAVGTEPLTALFAKYGCEIVATDQGEDVAVGAGASAAAWAKSGEHAASLEQLNGSNLCPDDEFRRLVTFEPVDINHIPPHLTGFDFCWSAGSVEHIGNLELSLIALVNMTNCVRPGGVSVHTTEFNLLSDDLTLTEWVAVLYRRRDVTEAARMLREAGHRLVPVSGRVRTGPSDDEIDLVPYIEDPHLRLDYYGFTITAIGLIIESGAVPAGERDGPGEPTWFDDEFFSPEALAQRETFGRAGESRQLQKRLRRLTELVGELREIAAGQAAMPLPAYRYAEIADFRRAARPGEPPIPLGDGTVLAQLFRDTRILVRAADPAAPDILRDGATDLPASVNAVRVARAGMTALVVGAGNGYHALLLARLVGPEGAVVAAEGDPALAALLSRGAAANQLARVEVHARRVSDGTDERDCAVEELLLGRVPDFVRVGDPAQVEATWAGLSAARAAKPGLVAVLAFHPKFLADAEAFLARVRGDGYNVSFIDDDGNVAPVPALEGAFKGDAAPWTLFASRG